MFSYFDIIKDAVSKANHTLTVCYLHIFYTMQTIVKSMPLTAINRNKNCNKKEEKRRKQISMHFINKLTHRISLKTSPKNLNRSFPLTLLKLPAKAVSRCKACAKMLVSPFGGGFMMQLQYMCIKSAIKVMLNQTNRQVFHSVRPCTKN